MQPVDVVDAGTHLCGNILPGLEVEIPFLQKEAALLIVHSLDDREDVLFQIHQMVDVAVDLIFQHKDFDNDILHAVGVPGGASGHIAQCGGRFGSQIVQGGHLGDSLVQVTNCNWNLPSGMSTVGAIVRKLGRNIVTGRGFEHDGFTR